MKRKTDQKLEMVYFEREELVCKIFMHYSGSIVPEHVVPTSNKRRMGVEIILMKTGLGSWCGYYLI